MVQVNSNITSLTWIWILGYAFSELDLDNKEIQELGDMLKNFPFLRYINLRNNKLKDIKAILHVSHLLVVNAAKNQI